MQPEMSHVTSIVIALVSYFLGTITGFVIKSSLEKKKASVQANTVVLYVVSGIWCISMIVDIISPVYETSPLVHGLMGAIVGFFYRPNGSQNRKGDQ